MEHPLLLLLLLIHGNDIDLCPGPEDGQFLHRKSTFVILQSWSMIAIEFGLRGDQQLVDSSQVVQVPRHSTADPSGTDFAGSGSDVGRSLRGEGRTEGCADLRLKLF